MRSLLRSGVVLSALFAAASPAAAQYAPWCMSEVGRAGSGATTCIYYSFAQCMATQSGIGGICFQNPYPGVRGNPDSARSGWQDQRRSRSRY